VADKLDVDEQRADDWLSRHFTRTMVISYRESLAAEFQEVRYARAGSGSGDSQSYAPSGPAPGIAPRKEKGNEHLRSDKLEE